MLNPRISFINRENNFGYVFSMMLEDQNLALNKVVRWASQTGKLERPS